MDEDFTLTKLCDVLYNHFSKCINTKNIQECPEHIIDLTKHPKYEDVLNTPTEYSQNDDAVYKIDGINNITRFRKHKYICNALKYENKLCFFKVLETDESDFGTKYYSPINLPRVEIFEDGVFLSKIVNIKDTPEMKLECWQINLNPQRFKKKWSWFGGGRKSNKKRDGSKKNKKKKKSTQRK